MVYLGPLGPVDPDTGAPLQPVDAATDDDLEWLNRHAELAGWRARFVRAGSREDRTWLRMEMIRG